jgi:LmbE family N-acetylglucosaminyl deacetylase
VAERSGDTAFDRDVINKNSNIGSSEKRRLGASLPAALHVESPVALTSQLKRVAFTFFCAAALMLVRNLSMAETNSPAEILQDLRSFREMGTVLYVAAHPDDEDTQLIAYLARGRDYRTAYLSVTRGDGGQNVLGPEFDEELGVIRTQELLAARRLDGGRQFFTRAIDFGFSKDYRETLKIWDKQQVLSDVVRVIRTFQPDVVIAGFSAQQTPGQHGHHVASAVLAGEAFKLAGDPKAFPDQFDYLKPWQPKRLLQNVRFGGRGGGGSAPAGPHLEISGDDPVMGISFGELAGRSRAMHKSQGFGNFGGGGGGSRTATFLVLDGESATNDIMDGIDTTWSRVPGGAEIGKEVDEIIAKFDLQNPSASMDALLKLRKNLASLPKEPLIEEKRGQLDKILQNCLGLSVVTTIPQAEVVPGEKLALHTTATVHSKIPVFWVGLTHGSSPGSDLQPDVESSQELTDVVPANTPLSQPYWLREESSVGTFRVSDSKLIGSPENPPVLPISHLFRIGGTNGQLLTVTVEPVQAGTESGKFEARRTLKVIPPVSLRCENEVALFAPDSSRDVGVEVVAARADVKGELSLNAPAGWKVTPAEQPFHLALAGEHGMFSFKVTAPSQPTIAQITARAKIGDATFDNQHIEISYPHIPEQLLQPPARIKAVALDLAIRGKKVGYIPGAGDSVAEALKQMGYEVTTLGGDDLTTNRLKDFDAVVVGIRAFNVRNDLISHLPALFAFVESGGNVIEQYNRPGNDSKTDKLTPYSLRLSNDRVTDETAAIKFLVPEHPSLNVPNKITSADFDGWVQERGIYFPNQWDEHFTPILACSDPGEEPKSGSLLIAPYGKGYFVYTGLDFFRELPAGVPGAYRLFANLVSLGK